MIINLTTPMSDDKERQRRNEVILAAIERHTEKHMNDDHTATSQPTQSDALLEGDAQTILYLLGVRHGREDERAKIAAETRQPTQSDDNFHKLALSESFERVAKVAEERAAFNAGIEAAANALEADAKRCDCFARNEGECGCGAWCEWKSITSARAVEIVRKLKDTK
jgi:hypothetical protein